MDPTTQPASAAQPTKPAMTAEEYTAKVAAIHDEAVAQSLALNARTDLAPAQKMAGAQLIFKTAVAQIGNLGAAPTGFKFQGQELLCTTGTAVFTGVQVEGVGTDETGDYMAIKDGATGVTGTELFKDLGREVTIEGNIEASSGTSTFTAPRKGAVITIAFGSAMSLNPTGSQKFLVQSSSQKWSEGVAKCTIKASAKDSLQSGYA